MRSPLFIPTSRRSPLNRAMEGRDVAAARSAAVALVAEVSAVGRIGIAPRPRPLPSLCRELGGVLADALGEESHALQLRLQRQAEVGYPDPHDALFVASYAWTC